MGMSKRLKNLTHRREVTLSAYYTHRVIFAHISPSHHRQALSGRDRRYVTALPMVDRFNAKAAGCAYENQHIIDFLGCIEDYLLVPFYIMNLEGEAAMHIAGYDQADGVERVGKDFV